MPQGGHAEFRQISQQRRNLQNYNVAKQKLAVNDRNAALSLLNSQLQTNQQNVGTIQRQLHLQEQQQIAQRNQSLNLLNQQQQVQRQAQYPSQGMQPGMMQSNIQAQYPSQGMQPGMMQPGQGMQPGMMHPNMMQSGMMHPNMIQPNMMQHGMMHPNMMQSGMMQQQMQGNMIPQMQPGMNPQMMYPGMSQQTMMQSGGIQPNHQVAPVNTNGYQEPPWSSRPRFKFQLRLVENGRISFVDLVSNKNYFLVGRAESCDIQLETTSVSRQHCAIQHRGGGSQQGSDELFIFDLGSTSGTFLNSQQLTVKSYYALQPGDRLNFGTSPDFIVCGGPNNYQPPLPIIQQQHVNTSSLSSNEVSTQSMDDEIDAIINAECSDHLKSSLATLEGMFEAGTILDAEYYKKKALIQEQMRRQQQEMKMKIKQKKAEARSKQHLEDTASKQRAQQNALLAKNVEKTSNLVMKNDNTPTQAIPVDNSLEKAFNSVAKAPKPSPGQFATIKMDPRSADFDAVAYKRMMVEQYEQQKRDNEIQLRLRKLGDPTSNEFNPQEYKRLMVEQYEHKRQMEETNRKIQEARG